MTVFTSPEFRPYRAALARSTLMFRFGCPRTGKDAQVGDAANLAHLVPDLRGQLRQDISRFGPMILTELAPLTPEIASSMLSWMYWEKLKMTPGQLALELRLDLLRQLVLGHPLRPLVVRLERHEQLDVGERRGVAAVVRPAMLGDDGDHLRMPQQNQAHLSAWPPRRPRSESVDRHGGANPEIALFQVRQKLAAQPRGQERRRRQEDNADADHRGRGGPARNAARDCKPGAAAGRRSSPSPSTCSGRKNDASTGVTVKVAIKAPASAYP